MKKIGKSKVRQSRVEKQVKTAKRQAKAAKPVEVHEVRRTKIQPKAKWVPPDPHTDRLDPSLKAIRDGKAKIVDLIHEMNDRARYYFNVFYPHFYDGQKNEVVPTAEQLAKGVSKNDKLLDAQVRGDFAALGGCNPEIAFQYRTPKDAKETWIAYKHVPGKKGKK
jgi:hypothetical protein